MNTDFDNHIPEAIFEDFAMEMLSEDDCAFWEEHLLVCSACQDRLVDVDEYIRVMKDAAASVSNPEFQERRALAKPMMAATHAALLLACLFDWHIMFQLR